MPCPFVFVDLETTGATATADRITEIGIVEVSDAGVTEWSTLVNPETRISEFIERLTGISNSMVANAPTFAAVAEEVLSRLQGRLFIAHNARFDYGFLKNEFKRAGYDFRATVLCTVKLSRRFSPMHPRHNLDALIERHGLSVSDRHRALGDARLIWQLWQKLEAIHGSEALQTMVAELTARPSLPPHLDANLLEDLPEGHGVYLFYAENDLPLYIGKSKTLRKRVLAHFASDHSSSKEMSLSQQIRRVEWIETEGELGALLKEAELIKKLQPTQNQRLRKNEELCSWRLAATPAGDGLLKPLLALAQDSPPDRGESLYGLFKCPRDAKRALMAIAEEHGLCEAVLELEQVTAGKPCFARQLHKCKGACVGAETAAQHNLRLLAALHALALKPWPYDGPVGVKEGEQLHVIKQWRYLGTALTEADLAEVMTTPSPAFDADIYKLLVKHIGKKTTTVLRLKQRTAKETDTEISG
jgi:DNA polymerase-3 subunit epsilon